MNGWNHRIQFFFKILIPFLSLFSVNIKYVKNYKTDVMCNAHCQIIFQICARPTGSSLQNQDVSFTFK